MCVQSQLCAPADPRPHATGCCMMRRGHLPEDRWTRYRAIRVKLARRHGILQSGGGDGSIARGGRGSAQETGHRIRDDTIHPRAKAARSEDTTDRKSRGASNQHAESDLDPPATRRHPRCARTHLWGKRMAPLQTKLLTAHELRRPQRTHQSASAPPVCGSGVLCTSRPSTTQRMCERRLFRGGWHTHSRDSLQERHTAMADAWQQLAGEAGRKALREQLTVSPRSGRRVSEEPWNTKGG